MSTCVCVLSNSGERLMPTFRLGKVRHLLKDGKAKIVKHHPFTIQLLYDSKTNTQPIEICEDVGYNYIGISVKSQSHEYVSAQYDTLQDEKEHHDDCRKYRRTRRNRLRPSATSFLVYGMLFHLLSARFPAFSFARMCELNTMKRERSSDGIETDKAERTPAHSQGPCHAENCH